MNRYNLQFCDQFQYPPQIREHFVDILDQICLCLGAANVRLVVLFGSTSRGELTYEVTSDDRIDLFSDYEFLIVTRRGVSGDTIVELSHSFSENKVRWGITNPLFHIEFMHDSLLKYNAKRYLVRNIASFELFRTGIVVYGDESEWNKSSPRITAQNLNIGAVNELIIERLWKQLQIVGETDSSHIAGPHSDRVANYFTSRNALEVLTILLPNEGVLLPGYRTRYAYFSEHYRHGHPLPTAYHEFMRDCLDAKLHLKFTRAFDDYYEQMLAGFLALTGWLVDGNSSQPPALSDLPDVCSRLVTAGKSIFREPLLWQGRRVARDYRAARRLKLPHPIKWALWEKRPYMLALLFYVHSWILSQLQCRSLPDGHLREAQRLLARVQPATGGDVQDWQGVVAQLRTIMAMWRRSS